MTEMEMCFIALNNKTKGDDILTKIELTEEELETIRTALSWYYDQAWDDEQYAEINRVAPKFGISFEDY